MSRLVAVGRLPRGRLEVEVADGAPATAAVDDPDRLLARFAGLAGPQLRVHLGRREVGSLAPPARARAGLATVTGRLPGARDLVLVDLLLLAASAAHAGAGGLLAAALGTAAGTAAARDRDAAVRALAGALGIGAAMEHPLAALDPETVWLADLARALAAEPRAVVVRDPDWLTGEQHARATGLARPLLERCGAAVLVLTRAGRRGG